MKPENFYFAVFKDFMRRYWYLFTALAIAIVAGFSSYFYITYILKKPATPPITQNQPAQPIPQITNQAPKTAAICPLDGTILDELPSRRVLAASIDNSPEARPQSGLKEADLVLELPVEGGLTRLLAFYYHGDAARIGPIRSARPYIAAKAAEYGAVILHAGQSPQTLDYFQKTKAEHIDEIPNTPGFWREPTRKPPYNLYTSTMNMWDFLKKNGKTGLKSLKGLKFSDNAFLNGQSSSKVTIFYPYGEVRYEYQPIDKYYLRFIGNKAHIDGESFLPLQIKNIVIQFVNTRVLDGEGRLAVNLEAKGRAIIASGGKTYEGTWSKTPNDVTHYYDNVGREAVLPPGQTWIEIIQNNMEVDY